jgi:Protein of unknown function (DUF1360)
MTSWLIVAVLALGTYRLAHAVSTEEVSEPARSWLARRFPPSTQAPRRWQTGEPIPDAADLRASWPVRLVSCEWCTAWWVAGGLCAACHALAGGFATWGWTAISWPAVAAGSGVLTRYVS